MFQARLGLLDEATQIKPGMLKVPKHHMLTMMNDLASEKPSPKKIKGANMYNLLAGGRQKLVAVFSLDGRRRPGAV